MLKARFADHHPGLFIPGDRKGTQMASQPTSEHALDSNQPADSPFARSFQRHLGTRRGLLMHTFLFAVVAVDLLLLNMLTNQDTIWAVWPIGVWAILLAAQTGFSTVKPGFFGMHLVGGAAICIGLAIINIFHGRDDASGGGWWVVWPILAWFFSVVIHLPFAFDLVGAIRNPSRRSGPPRDR